jgi:hypothetical protein
LHRLPLDDDVNRMMRNNANTIRVPWTLPDSIILLETFFAFLNFAQNFTRRIMSQNRPISAFIEKNFLHFTLPPWWMRPKAIKGTLPMEKK